MDGAVLRGAAGRSDESRRLARKHRQKSRLAVLPGATPGASLSVRMVLNPDRLQAITEHVREAQRLAQEEAHSSHGHRMVCRLAGMLSVCRDLADDLLEQALQGEQRRNRHGRERTHF